VTIFHDTLTFGRPAVGAESRREVSRWATMRRDSVRGRWDHCGEARQARRREGNLAESLGSAKNPLRIIFSPKFSGPLSPVAEWMHQTGVGEEARNAKRRISRVRRPSSTISVEEAMSWRMRFWQTMARKGTGWILNRENRALIGFCWPKLRFSGAPKSNKLREHARYFRVFCRERENRGLLGGSAMNSNPRADIVNGQ
jgi:hypothetical protein